MKKENFEKKFIRKGPDECWIWIGTRTRKVNGYGSLSVWHKNKRSIRSAHSFSHELYKGPVPKGMDVMHSCDVRLCVNPAHLRVGTRIENIHDMHQKGRQAIQRGEDCGRTKLTEEDVHFIRSHYRPRHREWSGPALARRFGMDNQSIYLILWGINWKHI